MKNELSTRNILARINPFHEMYQAIIPSLMILLTSE